MFISESWQLKLQDESVFPTLIGSQFQDRPYGAGRICHSLLMAHVPMKWKRHESHLHIRKEKETFISIMLLFQNAPFPLQILPH